MATTVWILIAMIPLVRSDYLLELDLQRYSNPGGKNFRDVCCEIQATTPSGDCLTVDTCDPKFNIRLVNFDRQMQRLGQDYNLGTFTNADTVTFGSCQLIDSDMPATGVPNPLRFEFTSAQFTPGNNLRVTMDITHTEGNRNDLIAGDFVLPLGSISGINSAFSRSITNFATAPRTLSFQFRYRLICTAGTCGSTCSQTSGCPGFSQACVPDCNQTTPCLNGGTCQSGRCTCPANYEGIRCESAVTTMMPIITTMAPPTTIAMSTQSATTSSSPSTTSSSNNVAVTGRQMTTAAAAKSDQSVPMTTDKTSGGIFLGASVLSSLILCVFTIFHL